MSLNLKNLLVQVRKTETKCLDRLYCRQYTCPCETVRIVMNVLIVLSTQPDRRVNEDR